MAVYSSADWHGCSKPALKLLDYLKPDDTLYYLGDAADRGPDGVFLLEKLLSDPRVKYIKGNHDYFIEAFVPELLRYGDDWDLCLSQNQMIDGWLHRNGGMATWLELLKRDPADVKNNFVYPIIKAPLNVYYDSPAGHTVFLEHAGCTPWERYTYRSHDPLWDREHFYDKWNNDMPNLYVVHGHTPVQYLKHMYGYDGQPPKTKEDMQEKKMWYGESKTLQPPTIIRYCNGHKFDIDCCTIASGRIALLNLDTFEEIYFDKEEE